VRWVRLALAGSLALLLCEALVDEWAVQLLDSQAPKVAKNALALFVFGLSVVLVVLERSWREFRSVADLAILALGAVIVLSAVANWIDPVLAAKALYVYLRGAIVFYAIRVLRPTSAWQARMLWVVGAWAVLNAIVAVAQVVLGPQAYTVLGWHDLTTAEVRRGQGFFAHPNDLGHLLGLSILVTFALAPAAKRWVLMAVLGAGLAATQSRESLLGVLLGLAIIGVHKRIGWRNLTVVTGAVVLAATIPLVTMAQARTEVWRRSSGVAAALGLPHWEPAQDAALPLCGRSQSPPVRGGGPGSPCRRAEPAQEIRIVYARQGLALLAEKPLLGYGPGTFGGIVALEADPGWNTHPRFGASGFDLHGFHGKTVDSFWLHLLVEVGIVGVLAYLGWLWAATVRGPDSLGWALTGFAAVVAVFSPALEGPLVPPLLFAALALIRVRWEQDRPDSTAVTLPKSLPPPDSTGCLPRKVNSNSSHS
jgi:O-Antigen ligase